MIGQSINKKEIIKYKIYSISEMNEQNELEVATFYNEDGNPIHRADGVSPSVSYSYEGQLLKIDTAMSFEGPIQSVSRYIYNDKSQLVTILKEDGQDTLKSKSAFEYDSNGKEIKETFWSPSFKYLIEYKYEGDLLMEKAISNDTSVHDRMVYFEYDTHGRIHLKKETLYFGTSTSLSTCSYDVTGKLIEIKEKLENGSISTSYKYDGRGLLQSET